MKIDFSASIRSMNPINTEYDGYWFRSRLEARWAVFFDEVGIDWSYEVQGFRLRREDGRGRVKYLPDFYLQGLETPWEDYTRAWAEVKGVMKKKDEQKCKSLAIESESPVLLLQGDPVDEEITLYRKHTPVQQVKFAITRQNLKIIKSRTSDPSPKLVQAQESARKERFEK